MIEKNIQTISIDCATKIEQLNNLYDVLCDFRNKYGMYKRMNETEDKIFNGLYQLYEEEDVKVVDAENKVEKFFKDKIGKYWKLKITTVSNGHDYIQEYVIFPYDFNKDNHYFFAIMSSDLHENNTHVCELKDTSFSVDWFFRGNCTIEMKEITKDEFISESTKGINGIIDYILMRLEQRNG